MRSILNVAEIYQAFQIVFGFSRVRSVAFDEYLQIKPGDKIFDIGCGPGKILTYLPDGIEYHGFDVEPGYIEHAKKRYGSKGSFYCRPFDDSVLDEFNNADIVMFNGVVHHLPDALAEQMLATASKAVAPTGVVFTLDGCYRDGQSVIARKLLDFDRGEYVRTQDAYEALISKHFDHFEMFLREDLSTIPYTFLSGWLAHHMTTNFTSASCRPFLGPCKKLRPKGSC